MMEGKNETLKEYQLRFKDKLTKLRMEVELRNYAAGHQVYAIPSEREVANMMLKAFTEPIMIDIVKRLQIQYATTEVSFTQLQKIIDVKCRENDRIHSLSVTPSKTSLFQVDHEEDLDENEYDPRYLNWLQNRGNYGGRGRTRGGGRGGGFNRDYSKITCHNCGEKGHISRRCPQKYKQQTCHKGAACTWEERRGSECRYKHTQKEKDTIKDRLLQKKLS
eukprot:262871_1